MRQGDDGKETDRKEKTRARDKKEFSLWFPRGGSNFHCQETRGERSDKRKNAVVEFAILRIKQILYSTLQN